MDQAWKTTRGLTGTAFSDRLTRADAIERLAPWLATELLPELLALTRELDLRWRRAELLRALAPRLVEDQLWLAISDARALPDELYQWISIITPNEKEASLLTGVEVEDEVSARRAAKILADKGVAIIIITMGSRGALLYDGAIFTHIATPVVEAIDTTAAGDVFNGALVVALSEGKDLADAVSFACDVSAISVTRRGAQSSVPYRSELS